MTEKIKSISNPLTIIAIFAALAEINATVSIGLVDKELQETFIWFVIVFPILLVILFFLTLNFNTKVIYAPSDYKDDKSFQKMLIGESEPDREINYDKDIINKTLTELGIKKQKPIQTHLDVSENVSYLFSARYSLEKELRRLTSKYFNHERPRSLTIMLRQLVEQEIISPVQHRVIRNIFLISSYAIHGEEQKLTIAEIDFVKKITPSILDEIKKIE